MTMNKRGQTYFGAPDASVVQNKIELKKVHVPQDIESELKYGNRVGGFHTVVGVKGSGKTDLRKHIEAFEPAYILNLSVENAILNLEADSTQAKSGVIMNTMATVLLRAFANYLETIQDSKFKQSAKNFLRKTKDMAENIPESVELTLSGVGKVSLGKLLKGSAPAIIKQTNDALFEDIIEALTATQMRGYILIDDVDDVISGIENNVRFLEGVARSLSVINQRCGERLHALMFLKHGIWKSWATAPDEYDKVEDRIAFLTWDHDSLVRMIGLRIASVRGLSSEQDTEALWKAEFNWQGDFAAFTEEVTGFCVNGPRDMVKFCNLAAARAGDKDSPITIEHFRAALGDYSQGKIRSLAENYNALYPGITFLVTRAFRKAAGPEMTAKELAERIQQNILVDPLGQNDENIDKKLRSWPKERLALLMFEIGVVGFRVGRDIEYVIESPVLSEADFMAQQHVVIHPAFRKHLGIASQ
jgi:hypothetical protein